ncbi:hypothetical protein ACTZWW_20685 [Salinarimonas sp. NSM]|uniref:hypothetical protein n=1 Tax=Salinarimonas sp. NSM TaxID=3458003 RepID=UPI0040366495
MTLLSALMLAACDGAPETAQDNDAPPAAVESEAPAALLSEPPPVARQPSIPPPSTHVALNPGAYRADDITLSLSALRFELEAPGVGIGAEGRYEIINGVLELAATAGETGEIAFPLECRLSRVGPGIAFEDVASGSCGPLAELQFQRDTRPGALDAD